LSLLFIDTSALAKRYLIEAGSAWIMGATDVQTGNVVIIADLTTVEMSSLLARRVREGVLAQTNATLLLNAFLLHVDGEYLTVPLDSQVLAQARALVGRHPLRALDAMQLACAQRARAILSEPLTLITSDQNLLAAAGVEGLPTDDPLVHP
jgi:predicted nucleic acid-binding protein